MGYQAKLLCFIVVVVSVLIDKAGYHGFAMVLIGFTLADVAVRLDQALAAIITLDEVRGR